MDPFVRMVYFAYSTTKSLDDWRVIDIEKYPEIKEKYDTKGKGKYFLLEKGHYQLHDRESEGTIQEIINRM